MKEKDPVSSVVVPSAVLPVRATSIPAVSSSSRKTEPKRVAGFAVHLFRRMVGN